MPRTSSKFGALQALQIVYAGAAVVEGGKLQLEKSLGCSHPLVRQSLWLVNAIPPSHKSTNI